MVNPSEKIVQLIHIKGPFMGEIHEYPDQVITIGRHPSCIVRFPADLTRVSRKHAKIIREGNRFKFVDTQSTNRSFVNGKPVAETYLQSGDVIQFAAGGPKVSFLIQTKAPHEVISQKSNQQVEDLKAEQNLQDKEIKSSGDFKAPSQSAFPPESSSKKVKAPLVIQHGPSLRSFSELPVIIGNSRQSDFLLDHQSIGSRHAEITFGQDNYWIKDLTGQSTVLVNGRPIGVQIQLKPQDIVAMTSEGPFFVFLGQGRMAETEPEA